MQSVLNEEGLISGILKLFSKSGERKNTTYMKGSISKYSKNLIMSFPILADSAVSIDRGMLCMKANERNIVQMLQILFSSINLDYTHTQNVTGADIIAQYYDSIDPNMNYNDFVDLLNKITGDSGNDLAGAAKINTEAVQELMREFKSQKPFKKDSINEKSLNDYVVMNINGNQVVKEAYKPIVVKEADATDTKEIDQKDIDVKNKNINDVVTNRIVASNAKKANDLEPTLMVINYNTITNGINGNAVVDKKSFIAGVKCRYIPVDTVDMVERFVSKERTKLSLKNLIRATTGEISLWKDFILCVDKAKMDAKNSVKKGYVSQIWNLLEKRANKNSINKIRKDNSGAAITTCIISQDTVNYMKNQYKFDLENIANAKMILEAYNLLGLVICDDSIECAKFLYDGNNEFELLAYSSLAAKADDKDYKALVNLINRGR